MRQKPGLLLIFLAALSVAATACGGGVPSGDAGPDGSVAPDGAMVPDGGGGPVCGNEACEPGETCVSCPADCTTGCTGVCGDGSCDIGIGERCATCPADCTTGCTSVCGDDICDAPDECPFCPPDCAGSPECGGGACGDFFCDELAGECETCPMDCPPGSCGGGGWCGDFVCDAFESCATCLSDCPCVCGNGLCESGECGETGTCVADCPGGCPACAHDPCAVGELLDPACDACVAAICAVDGFCCSSSWDSLCASEVVSVCGKTCPEVCGDFICSVSETCTSCPGDCGACPICGDGWCDFMEDCTSCPGDCGFCPSVCGMNGCEPGETCLTCSGDCGACVCGNGSCEFPSETCSSCPGDCGACVCGDGLCNAGETCVDCPADCECASCDHTVCEAGGPLAPSCDPCAELLCTTEPWCCTSTWDFWCINDAQTVCGKDCMIPASCGDGFCGMGEDCTICPIDCFCP